MTPILLALQIFAATADGQTYPVKGGPLLHAATKSVASAAVYAGLRHLKVTKPVAALLSTVGVLVASKTLEVAKGHTLGPVDTIHDMAWHAIPVASVALNGRIRLTLVGVLTFTAMGTCERASPKWC